MPVVVLVADGARVDAFDGDMRAFPALARLKREGGLHTITSVFPSVTGPAYTPFLVGRFPGAVGIPGIRWYDRTRTACSWPDYARSYVGHQFRRFDDDLDAGAPTIFELVPGSVGALSVVTRGLAPTAKLGTLNARSAVRMALTHFSGHVEHWLDVDREVLDTIPRRIREDRPPFTFAALAGVDKASHARGHGSALVRDALSLVDETAARIRSDAERGGWWDDTHLWIVSDHGHSPVSDHEDLADTVECSGWRTVSHPWVLALAPDVAVMVSGNAMAHVYVDASNARRSGWNALRGKWNALAEVLLAREATDLLLLPLADGRCLVRSARRGSATVARAGDVFSYVRERGDPLMVGSDFRGTANEAYDAFRTLEYPDALAQIVDLASAPRSGDMILSAAPGWDFRARYEPIPHVSSHGSLHRDHMLVPLLLSRPPARAPQRTTDIFASALAVLGVTSPMPTDGRSFV